MQQRIYNVHPQNRFEQATEFQPRTRQLHNFTRESIKIGEKPTFRQILAFGRIGGQEPGQQKCHGLQDEHKVQGKNQFLHIGS